MFRIDVIRQFRVKVGGRSRFSPMRIALVSIPLLVAPIFFALGGGNGKPSKYLGASIYPARQVERDDTKERKREREREREAANTGKGKLEIKRERKSSCSESGSSAAVISKGDCRKSGRKLKDGGEKSKHRPAYRDY